MIARRVVAGVGPDGRSTVISAGEPPQRFRIAGARSSQDPHEMKGMASTADTSPPGDDEILVYELWKTEAGVELGPAEDPTLRSAGFDVECPPGGTRWRLVVTGPHRGGPMHTTETTDYDVILEGEIDLLLDTGPVRLRPGDAVIVPGVRHAWRTGDEPCTMLVGMVDSSR